MLGIIIGGTLSPVRNDFLWLSQIVKVSMMIKLRGFPEFDTSLVWVGTPEGFYLSLKPNRSK